MVPVLDVFTRLPGAPKELRIGRCRFAVRRGKLSCTFTYEDAYLTADGAFAIDPSLPLRAFAYHTDGLPGAMRDSSPDRWGRHLIARMLLASNDQVHGARAFDDVDFLIGVHDEARQGALRFSLPDSDERLSSRGEVPPVVDLKRLVFAADVVATENEGTSQLKELLDAGSGSLGGARPKASVLDGKKLLLAKFPHPGDEWDVMAWEKTALDVARSAGVPVPITKLMRLGKRSVLLLERFDREESAVAGERIPYLSAMSLVGASDGADCDYVDVAEAIADWCEEPAAELKELFRRVTLSIALHNTDDHLRNLGFIRRKGTWRLSPAFDVNIEPDLRKSRATAVYGEVDETEIEGLRGFAEVCGCGPQDAAAIVRKVTAACGNLRVAASRNGCPQSECSLMASTVENRCKALQAAFAI